MVIDYKHFWKVKDIKLGFLFLWKTLQRFKCHDEQNSYPSKVFNL